VLTAPKLAWLRANTTAFDVLFLAEVGATLAPSLPGYVRVDGAMAAARSARGCGRGTGLCALVRRPLAGSCRLEQADQHCMWLRLRRGARGRGSGVGSDDDIFIGGAYFPPATSVAWRGADGAAQAAFEGLRDTILALQQRGRVLLFGDFNAHTGSLADVAPPADDVLRAAGAAALAPSAWGVPAGRLNPDRASPTAFGRWLVERVCLPTACVILNGRAPGAGGPLWTLTTRRADCLVRSCIDYALADARLYSRVAAFNILPHHGVSDHNILECILLPPPATPAAPAAAATGDALPPALRYDDAKHADWVAAIKSDGFQRRLDAALALPGPAAEAAFTDLLRDAARPLFGAREHARQPAAVRQPREQPWFRYCRREHAALQAAARQRLGAAERRRRRNAFNTAKRRAQRRWQAEQNNKLMGMLRGKPRAFWTAYKQDDGVAADAGVSPSAHAAHWRAQLGPVDCGALEDTGAVGPRELAAALELEAAGQAADAAAAADGGGPPAAQRQQAAAELNSPFTGEEVWVQVRRMRAGAAPGLDGLGACLLKNAYEWVEDSQGRPQRAPLLADAIAQLFTQIVHTRYPPNWNEQPLTPVFKGKGSASDLCNYRPIQSQCALAKLFSMTLHSRLDAFAEGQGLRAQGQAGFRHKRRASDNIFVLRHLIDAARLSPPPNHHLYACFVDFEKAYDSVHRDALMRFLASVGVHGHMLATLCDMYWHVRARPKVRGRLGPAFETTCGVRQGDPLSPLLFGMYIDRIEAHLARHASGVGARLAGLATPLQVLLYADDLVLLGHSASALQTLLDSLGAFCEAHHLRVNISKTEVVVFGRRTPRHQPALTYAGSLLPVSKSFRYLGIVLHSTRGARPAVEHLRRAALRALWSLQSRCRSLGVVDFALRARLYRALVEPILTYGAEVWSPDLMPSLHSTLLAPLQAIQNDFVRGLGGLRRAVPALILAAESGLPPLGEAWLRACSQLWGRASSPPGSQQPLLVHALRADIALTASLPATEAHRTWSGALHRALAALVAGDGGAAIHTRAVADFWHAALAAQRGGDDLPTLPRVAPAWEAAIERRWEAAPASTARTLSARAQYREHFAMGGDEHEPEPAFPDRMPWYFRHTSRFAMLAHARSLMQVRCCSTPLAACPTNYAAASPACPRCNGGEEESVEHVLLDCPATHAIRADERFSHLFMGPWPQVARLRTFMHTPHQYALAKFIHACLQ
jgi:hypothetical protein